MKLDQVRSAITTAGFSIFMERRLPNDAGTQIVTASGQVVDVYDNGTVVVHGQDPASLRAALAR
jgi:hypothetical protein